MKKKITIGISAMAILVIAVTIVFHFSNTKILDNDNTIDNENATNDTKFITYKVSAEYEVLWISPKDLYENSDLVVLADYEEDIKSYPSESGTPMTLSNFNVKEVYKGNLREKTTIIPVNYRGGTITLEEYLSVQPQSKIEKQGYDKVSQNERKYTLFEYESSVQNFSLKDAPENYILFLDFDEDSNSYSILSADYGISKVNEKGQMYDYLQETYVDIPFDK